MMFSCFCCFGARGGSSVVVDVVVVVVVILVVAASSLFSCCSVVVAANGAVDGVVEVVDYMVASVISLARSSCLLTASITTHDR